MKEETEKIIWVLGSKSINADKSIGWFDRECPNLSNCDVLIVNLVSLASVKNINSEFLYDAGKYIFDLMMTGTKDVIFIMPESMENIRFYDLMPIYPIIRKVAPSEYSEFRKQGSFNKLLEEAITAYLAEVKRCSYYIRSLNFDLFWGLINPESDQHENYDFTKQIGGYNPTVISEVTNKANQRIGETLKIYIIKGPSDLERILGAPLSSLDILHVSGAYHLLPPPTEVSPNEGIDIIVNHLVGVELKEPEPEWSQRIDLPGLQQIQSNIDQAEKELNELKNQIDELQTKKDGLVKFRTLLWTTGEPLNQAVKDAFILLGFEEIRRERTKNKEDWIIDFKFHKPLIGLLEIKGVGKRTSQADIVQCNKWVDDYMIKGISAKGIFIPNQHRREDVKKTKSKRQHFEDNEIDFAKSRKICILPTHEIFNAVFEVLKGNKQMTRQFIEKTIIEADPLCELT